MKKWRCTVCGYIHTGDEPPEKCPVCGADKSMFEEITEAPAEVKAPETETEKPDSPPPAVKSDAGKPSVQVVDDADKDRSALAMARDKVRETSFAQFYQGLTGLMTQLHAHPISVHMPNGLLPVSVLFVILGALLNIQSLETAAHYNMIVVLPAMPMVLFTGYIDWKNRYNRALTSVFIIKIICGILVTIGVIAIVFWRVADPGVTDGADRGPFLYLNILTLVPAGVAGYLGGKLVFMD